ncbi:MAG: T9SS type A sorting domain-containing protein [candidate division KSB1 bacterium]|nr:T9SS type A sorting domain-containing protein [candidate division KSB1 bacterium]
MYLAGVCREKRVRFLAAALLGGWGALVSPSLAVECGSEPSRPVLSQEMLALENMEVVTEGGSYGVTDLVRDLSGRVYVSFLLHGDCPEGLPNCALAWMVRSGNAWEGPILVTSCVNFVYQHRLAMAGRDVLLLWIERDVQENMPLRVALCVPGGTPQPYTLLDSSQVIPLAAAWTSRALYVAAREGRVGYNWGFRIFKKEEGGPFVSLPFRWAWYWDDTGGMACEGKQTVHLPGQAGSSLGYLVSPDGGGTWLMQKVPEFRPRVYKPKVAVLGTLRVLVWLESSAQGLFADRLVAASSKDGEKWSPTVLLAASQPSEIILEPELVSGSRSFLVVFWQEGRFFQGQMRCCYSVFDGHSWSGPFLFAPDSAVDISTPRGRIDPVSDVVHLSYSAVYPSGREVVWYATARVSSTGVEPERPWAAPRGLALRSAYPNPFNTSVTIPLCVPADAEGVLEVVDALGRTVAVVWQGRGSSEWREARWDGRAEGLPAPSGLYLLRLRTDVSVVSQKVALVR